MATMRSPNYPALGLGDAIQRVRLLWQKEKRTPVPAEVAAMAIGYSGISGPSRTALAAMKKYGLVESDDRTVRVSELALRILHPADEQEQIKATQEAALKPELFSQLYESHPHASDDAIVSYLITRLDFSQGGAHQAVKTFRETLEVSRLANPVISTFYNRPSESIQVVDNSMISRKNVEEVPYTSMAGRVFSHSSPEAKPSKTWRWPLSPEVDVEVKITGGEIKPEFFDTLKKYLDVAREGASPAFQVGDRVEFDDAYTGETRYGLIDRVYGNNCILRSITKEEAGPNPKRFSPKADPRIAQLTNGTGIVNG